jgi:hypothetical protein
MLTLYLQVAAAVMFAVALNKAAPDFAEDFYKDVTPRVKLCNVKPMTAHHVKVFAGQECYPEWPSFGDNGKFSLGIIVTEGLHVFALNFVAGLVLPHVGALVPLVIPCIVITTIRSPLCYLPGPALNLIPATAGAVLHGGLDSWRAHALGCGLGMFLAFVANQRLHTMKTFTSAWSFRMPEVQKEEQTVGRKTCRAVGSVVVE